LADGQHQLAARELIFLDESRLDIRMTRRCTRAERGQRALGRVPCGRRQQVLLPALAARPGSIVVLDNLQPHKAACVRDAFCQAGVAVRFLPPYSPDFNPIEPCWSKLKTLLRGTVARLRSLTPFYRRSSTPSHPTMPELGSSPIAMLQTDPQSDLDLLTYEYIAMLHIGVNQLWIKA
jgi:DDE superfamily endonuclease